MKTTSDVQPKDRITSLAHHSVVSLYMAYGILTVPPKVEEASRSADPRTSPDMLPPSIGETVRVRCEGAARGHLGD